MHHFDVHSDQKDVLYEHIVAYAPPLQFRSILDIGAGNGVLARRLRDTYSEYLAIEEKDVFVKQLQEHSIPVLHARFPIELSSMYDMILCSHSFPESIEEYTPFIETAWKGVAAGGTLLAISFKGSDGLEKKLRDTYIGVSETSDDEMFQELIRLLQARSMIEVSRFQSLWFSDSLEDLALFASKTIGGSEEQKRKYLPDLTHTIESIRSQYPSSHRYVFPAQHVTVLARKA